MNIDPTSMLGRVSASSAFVGGLIGYHRQFSGSGELNITNSQVGDASHENRADRGLSRLITPLLALLVEFAGNEIHNFPKGHVERDLAYLLHFSLSPPWF